MTGPNKHTDQLPAHILVIDDDDLVRETLETLLLDAGYGVTSASDGRRGLAELEKKTPDFVVTDIYMPEKEGIETIVRPKQSDPDIKIIAMSDGGYLRTAQRYLKMASGLGDKIVLEKPLIGPLVISAAKELLQD